MISFLVRTLDIVWREPKMIFKYYLHHPPKTTNIKNVFMVDGKVGHGGMFDRLKGAISVYAISKIQQKEFKIYFNYPFELQKYLEPNNYNWLINKEDVVYSYPHSRPLFLYGECYDPKRLFKKRNREAHFYYGYDSLDKINEHYGTAFEWGQLYRELFKPTPYLQQYINNYKQEIGSNYIVFHTRFLNLLGDKVETDINPELLERDRRSFMERMRDEIKRNSEDYIKKNGDVRIMLASDSMTFIEYMKIEMPDIYVVPGKVKHIDTAGATTDEENVKMFLDYYLIGGAKKVYSLVDKGMWPSAFPEYAAKIGNAPFERIDLRR